MIKKTIMDSIYKAFLNVSRRNNKNIEYHLDLIATRTTSQYVYENLYKTNEFKTKYEVLDFAIKNIEINGVILEFGVFTGDTINYIANKLPNKKIYGFDSFEGLPEKWRPGFSKGMFAVENLPRVNNNIDLIPGWFDETLPKFIKNKKENISFIHIDCDLYSSTKIIFDTLAEFIIDGTVIVFDEYFNYPFWQNHEFKAFQEFIKNNKLNYEYLAYNKYDEQVAIKILKKIC